MSNIEELFEEDLDMPDPAADRRYAQLIGLDHVKARLVKEAEVILQPVRIDQWSVRHHGGVLAAVRRMEDRPPLFIFEGDVGSGKTTLAETFASGIARQHGISIKVRRLSLRSRGSGAVGEMTRLIGTAFDLVIADARKYATRRPTVLIIDEGDALAQSRATSQMHHEDRAGVNALIRGINVLTAEPKLATLIVLCTNRPGALDPGVRRRAAAAFSFSRPDDDQRRVLLSDLLHDTGITPADIEKITAALGPTDGRAYGYAYSDITDRLIPAAILAAYPDRPLSTDIILDQARLHPPTVPFADQP